MAGYLLVKRMVHNYFFLKRELKVIEIKMKELVDHQVMKIFIIMKQIFVIIGHHLYREVELILMEL
jgi:hypothetical protein